VVFFNERSKIDYVELLRNSMRQVDPLTYEMELYFEDGESEELPGLEGKKNRAWWASMFDHCERSLSSAHSYVENSLLLVLLKITTGSVAQVDCKFCSLSYR
jgi:hypothetical protein